MSATADKTFRTYSTRLAAWTWTVFDVAPIENRESRRRTRFDFAGLDRDDVMKVYHSADERAVFARRFVGALEALHDGLHTPGDGE